MDLDTYIDSYLTDCSLDKFPGNEFLISDILSEYGVDTESQAVDLKKLFSITRYLIWKKLATSFSTSFDFSADGSSYKTSQLYEFAKDQMLDCFIEAAPYLKSYKIEVEKSHAQPYSRYSEI
jgi:hypothetical protein